MSEYAQPLGGTNSPSRFYRLGASVVATYTNGTGLADWELALYVKKFGVQPSARDSDGDGVNDLQEFLLGLQPGKKDNPAVGLVVFTPLEK
jgi:hypothetical protein